MRSCQDDEVTRLGVIAVDGAWLPEVSITDFQGRIDEVDVGTVYVQGREEEALS
ncbi:MAG: hypothetical protein R6U70_03395 [Bacillota bacterium]